VRGNFWPGLTFTDLADLNRQSLDWLDTVANVRRHGTTGEVPFDRLPREHLQSMAGRPDYDTSLIAFRRATRDCLVSYEGNSYSVPCQYARRTLQIRATEDGLLHMLNAQGEEIACHRLAEGHRQRLMVAAHYDGIRPTVRPPRRAVAIQVAPPQDLAGLGPAPEVEARPLVWYDQLSEVAP